MSRRAVADGCDHLRETTGLSAVAVSGGVFQNLLLLDRAVTLLEERRFTVLTHCPRRGTRRRSA
ncbi:hypothetical protein DI270_000860 [Microbispora triticiradicis]|uniref:Carbamoyltransferase Kae1-like domain-containing protein n=1 Tax=Microbispora triticiradicis TaxID=2200763 RepID=A0ABX9LS36_9ACTN|nr:hypothetical protein [Microbispora triticiradicis]RGA06849.1 hypothetical protein DI270_000860 [Microbispora triticiradicis]GLW23416.1 hypothetical protein Mame01_34590 [Microbispora amethystogenes]